MNTLLPAIVTLVVLFAISFLVDKLTAKKREENLQRQFNARLAKTGLTNELIEKIKLTYTV